MGVDGTHFWNWSGINSMGMDRFEDKLEELQRVVQSTTFTEKDDVWRWEGDPSGTFSVKSLRIIINNMLNSPFGGLCFWNDWLPSRVNCFIWRALLKQIPTRTKLRSRGINIPSDLCPFCEVEE